MAEDGDRKRRLIMMLTIILAGSAVTFIDLSPVFVILIAFGIGLVMLFALKMISFDEIKENLSSLKQRLDQPIDLKKSKTKKPPGEKPKKEKAAEKEGRTKKELPFASLIQKIPAFGKKSSGDEKEVFKDESKKEKTSKISFISGLLNRNKNIEKKSREIDDLLDKTLSGEAEPSEMIEETTEEDGAAKSASEAGDGTTEEDETDDFSDFGDFDLGLEEDEAAEAPEDTGMSGMEEEIPDSAIADILAKEGIELELDDEEFPAAPEEDLGSEDTDSSGQTIESLDELDSDVSGLDLEDDELDDFDEIDLDEIETEDEIDFGDEDELEEAVDLGSEEAVEEPPVQLSEEEDILSAPPKEWTQTKTTGLTDSDENMFDSQQPLSLGGDGDEDDLFAMLKTDTKKAVSVQEISLVRDLKDANIQSEELVEGLEDVLEQFGIEREHLNKKENAADEEIINE